MPGGNKTLKRVFYQSAFASLRSAPESRTFYDRKRAEGKRHTLECIKTSASVVARVDGGKSYTKTGSAGSIANSEEVLVGAKTANPLDDMFDGSMDFVSIAIDQ
jgi:hypothetical protein